MPKYVLTDDDIQEILNLRARGKGIKELGQMFGCSENAIDWHCLRHGVDAPRNPYKSWDTPKGPLITERGNHIVRRFMPWEDDILQEMRLAGKTFKEIGAVLNRKHNSLSARLYALARRQERRLAALEDMPSGQVAPEYAARHTRTEITARSGGVVPTLRCDPASYSPL